MGYIKKSLQRINEILDNKELPKNWEKFVSSASKSENILIKRNNHRLYCTCCKKEFDYLKTIKKEMKCPYCHQCLEVKNWNIKKVEYHKNLILVEKVDDEYIFRIFELLSCYRDGEWDRSVVEYGRHFFNESLDIIRQNVCSVMGSYYVSHCDNAKYNKNKWRTFNSYWKRLSTVGSIYNDNLKELFKNTEYQYSQIWTLTRKMDFIDIETIMNNARRFDSFELLVKAGLYNLSLEASAFDKRGNFESRFGVSKKFYLFMKKHNITLDELDRLKILKQEDIRKVRYLLNCQVEYLEEVIKYINIDKFIEYSKKIGGFDINTYIDYLRFCEVLGFDMKDKKVLFPGTKRELEQKHDELEKQYRTNKDKLLNDSVKKRYTQLKQNSFKDNKYIIKPASTTHSLIEESKQQNNCVRTYAEKYAKGECDIYFMRSVSNPKKSLVTIEVRNNKVVQQRVKNNRDTTSSQKKFINLWQEKILNG